MYNIMGKKLLLSGSVITMFLIYSVFARNSGLGQPALIAQKIVPSPSPSQTTTPSLSPSPTPTDTSIQSGTDTPTSTPTPTPTPSGKYKDGVYTGSQADAFYGIIQVQTTVKNGKISNISFLQAPNDRSTSVYINSQADPILAQEAIQAQSANVDIVSGATDSSQAFIQSLQDALSKAQ